MNHLIFVSCQLAFKVLGRLSAADASGAANFYFRSAK